MATTATPTGSQPTAAANNTSDTLLFDESFQITSLDSAKYDRVSRLTAVSLTMDVNITLDVNTQLYPVNVGDTLNLVLASTLALDGAKDDGKGWRDTMTQGTLADMFDYVCHGKVYRFEDADGENM